MVKGVERQRSVMRYAEVHECEKTDEHRRTSRTVCHRLVTPLPTSFVKRKEIT